MTQHVGPAGQPPTALPVQRWRYVVGHLRAARGAALTAVPLPALLAFLAARSMLAQEGPSASCRTEIGCSGAVAGMWVAAVALAALCALLAAVAAESALNAVESGDASAAGRRAASAMALVLLGVAAAAGAAAITGSSVHWVLGATPTATANAGPDGGAGITVLALVCFGLYAAPAAVAMAAAGGARRRVDAALVWASEAGGPALAAPPADDPEAWLPPLRRPLSVAYVFALLALPVPILCFAVYADSTTCISAHGCDYHDTLVRVALLLAPLCGGLGAAAVAWARRALWQADLDRARRRGMLAAQALGAGLAVAVVAAGIALAAVNWVPADPSAASQSLLPSNFDASIEMGLIVVTFMATAAPLAAALAASRCALRRLGAARRRASESR